MFMKHAQLMNVFEKEMYHVDSLDVLVVLKHFSSYYKDVNYFRSTIIYQMTMLNAQ